MRRRSEPGSSPFDACAEDTASARRMDEPGSRARPAEPSPPAGEVVPPQQAPGVHRPEHRAAAARGSSGVLRPRPPVDCPRLLGREAPRCRRRRSVSMWSLVRASAACRTGRGSRQYQRREPTTAPPTLSAMRKIVGMARQCRPAVRRRPFDRSPLSFRISVTSAGGRARFPSRFVPARHPARRRRA